MSTAFADTSFFLALLNPEDEWHERAVELRDGTGLRIVTTTWVLVEVANGLGASRHRDKTGRFIRWLLSSPIAEVVDDPKYFFLGLDLFESRPDKEWSLTDCISFAVMKRKRLARALTADHHFVQAGFKALMR